MGAEYWPVDDPKFPYPIEDPDVTHAGPGNAGALSTIRLPAAIPAAKTHAEKSVGIARSWKFTFAVHSRTVAGAVVSDLVCTAKHVNWFPDHGEKDSGDIMTFTVSEAVLRQKGKQRVFQDRAHGTQHFDRALFSYTHVGGGSVVVLLSGEHNTWGEIGKPDEPYRPTAPGKPELPPPEPKDAPKPKPRPDARPRPQPGDLTRAPSRPREKRAGDRTRG